MHHGQLHPLLGDIVDAAGAGRLSRMRPFDLSGDARLRRNRGPGDVPTTHPLCLLRRQPASPGRRRRSSTLARDPYFGLRGFRIRPRRGQGAAGVSIPILERREFAWRWGFFLQRKSMAIAAVRGVRFDFRHRLPVSSFRVPAKAGTDMFVNLGRAVTMYFAQGFFRRIRSYSERVRL